MNIEELEKKAQEFELANTTYDVVESNDKIRTKKVCDITVQEAYVAGAEPREKRIEELEQQIKQMRCCRNCKFTTCSWSSETIKDGKRTSHYWNPIKLAYCDVGEGAEYQLWELKVK